MEPPVTIGNNIALCLNFSNAESMNKTWSILSQNATIMMPLESQLWGGVFGQLTDQHGVMWMFHGHSPPPASADANTTALKEGKELQEEKEVVELIPYFRYVDNCEEAVSFVRSILGGRYTHKVGNAV